MIRFLQLASGVISKSLKGSNISSYRLSFQHGAIRNREFIKIPPISFSCLFLQHIKIESMLRAESQLTPFREKFECSFPERKPVIIIKYLWNRRDNVLLHVWRVCAVSCIFSHQALRDHSTKSALVPPEWHTGGRSVVLFKSLSSLPWEKRTFAA